MSKLSEMVHSQKQELNSIEQHVELAKERTSLGLLELIRARRAKFAAVPVVGAVVGVYFCCSKFNVLNLLF